jgi:GNAT superfamily N-acetyltransferase
MRIRDALPSDEADWRVLWRGYTEFYETVLDEEVTAETWRRIFDGGSAISCRVAEAEGRLLGFATHVLHACTWTLAPICYLEDLFVDPAARGAGAGRALLEDLVALARERGWARLYWHTRAGNVTARRLYDRFATADDFVKYRIAMKG